MSIVFDRKSLEELRGKISDYRLVNRSIQPGLHELTVADYVASVVNGRIVAYEHNRGGEEINMLAVKSVIEKFVPSAFGQICLSIMPNGYLRLAEGHSRTEGLLQKLVSPRGLTESELNCRFSVQIIHDKDFFEAYQKRSLAAPHTAMQKLKNPDFFFGNISVNLRGMIGDKVFKSIDGKKLVSLSYIVNRLCNGTGKDGWGYSNLYANKHILEGIRYALKTKPPFVVTQQHYKQLVDAIMFYHEIIASIRASMKLHKDTCDREPVKHILSSAPFMTIILADYLSEDHAVGCSAKCVANRAMKNAASIRDICLVITGAAQSKMAAAETQLLNYLSPKNK